MELHNNSPILEFFVKFVEESFFYISSDVRLITIADIIIMIFWSIILSTLIAMTYRGTHKSVSYSQNFTQTLVLLNLIISSVMLIVGTDIARAFTLVGALSIIRFRTAIKDTRDMGFIFFTMVIGMACGTRFYLLGIIITLVGCTLLYYMSFVKFGKKHISQDILELNFPIEQDYIEILNPIFEKHLKYYTLLSIDSENSQYNRLSFLVTFKKKTNKFPISKNKIGIKTKLESKSNKSTLLSDIQKLPYIKNIKLIEGTSSVEL